MMGDRDIMRACAEDGDIPMPGSFADAALQLQQRLWALTDAVKQALPWWLRWLAK